MKIKSIAAVFSCLALAMLSFEAKSQTKPVLFDGTFVAGYADHGAYLNCTGPGVRFTHKPFSLLAGLLPGLRIKKDVVAAGATNNTLFTPSLGVGATVAIKHFVVQVPLYYNAKTAAKDGKWNPGFGLGYKF